MIVVFPSSLSFSKIKLSPVQKKIVDLVLSGGAFVNPVAAAITSTSTKISTLTTQLGTLPSNTEKTNLLASLTTLSTLISGSLLTHTNRVSGVTPSIGANPPGFSGLLSIALAYHKIKDAMKATGTPTSDNFSPIFRSILGYAEQELQRIDTVPNVIANVNAKINAAVPEDPVYVSIKAIIDSMVTNLTAIINQDNTNYTTALAYIVQYSTATAILGSIGEDYTRYLLTNVNGSGTLNVYINERVKEINNK